jgi:hypothetical protein
MRRDTLVQIPLNRICFRLTGTMAIKGHSKGGRRSKGERHIVTSRMPLADAEKLFAVAEARGFSVSDYVAKLAREHLMTIDLEEVTRQEALPIARAS